MATLPEEDVFPEGIYRIETTDPVVGGPPNEATGAGITNIPAMQLAKRTRWLKNRVDALLAAVVAASTTVAGIVRLNSSTNSTSTTEAATPAAVKAVNDAVAAKAASSTTVTGGGLATGGGDLTENRTISVPVATQAEAEAGTDNTKAMTPLRVAQRLAVVLAAAGYQAASALLGAIAALGANGLIVRTGAGTAQSRSIAVGGGLSIANADGVAGNPTIGTVVASTAQAQGGTDNAALMTPLRTAEAIAARSFAGSQAWQNVAASRAPNTAYQNTTGRPIQVSVSWDQVGGETFEISSDGTTWSPVFRAAGASVGTQYGNAQLIVPNGVFYRITGGSVAEWWELR